MRSWFDGVIVEESTLDGLYDRDILAWSERQSALLRRAGADECLPESMDWPNIAEELEAIGRSELRACEGLLAQAIARLLKLHAFPESAAAQHWRSEAGAFLTEAKRTFSPSMRHRIDIAEISRNAMTGLRRSGQTLAVAAIPWSYPLTLEELFDETVDVARLVRRLG